MIILTIIIVIVIVVTIIIIVVIIIIYDHLIKSVKLITSFYFLFVLSQSTHTPCSNSCVVLCGAAAIVDPSGPTPHKSISTPFSESILDCTGVIKIGQVRREEEKQQRRNKGAEDRNGEDRKDEIRGAEYEYLIRVKHKMIIRKCKKDE